MNLSQRIKAARKHAGLTQLDLASRVGIAQTAISQLESGKTQRSSYLTNIAQACEVSPRWLALGLGDMLATEVEAWLLDETDEESSRTDLDAEARLKFNAVSSWEDSGGVADTEVQAPFLEEVVLAPGSQQTEIVLNKRKTLKFDKNSLAAHQVPVDKVACIVVSGNSMEPMLTNGSVVAANMAETGVIDGRMYAIDHAGQLRVKFLYRLPGGGVRMGSMNSREHPDESYTAEDAVSIPIVILGRVFWGASFFT
jgi:phage repressor protein C with HTH and peptisase S24 domain